MKKSILAAIFLVLICFIGTSWASNIIKTYTIKQRGRPNEYYLSGTTVVTGASAETGVSRIDVIDLAALPDVLAVGDWSLTYPHAGNSGVTHITFGILGAASGYITSSGVSGEGTGNHLTTGVTIPYYILVTNTPKTAYEVESYGVSNWTLVAAEAISSSDTPFKAHRFDPPPGRYMHVGCGSSSTDYNLPGVILTVTQRASRDDIPVLLSEHYHKFSTAGTTPMWTGNTGFPLDSRAGCVEVQPENDGIFFTSDSKTKPISGASGFEIEDGTILQLPPSEYEFFWYGPEGDSNGGFKAKQWTKCP